MLPEYHPVVVVKVVSMVYVGPIHCCVVWYGVAMLMSTVAVPPCVVVAKSYAPIHHQAKLCVICFVLYNIAL